MFKADASSKKTTQHDHEQVPSAATSASVGSSEKRAAAEAAQPRKSVAAHTKNIPPSTHTSSTPAPKSKIPKLKNAHNVGYQALKSLFSRVAQHAKRAGFATLMLLTFLGFTLFALSILMEAGFSVPLSVLSATCFAFAFTRFAYSALATLFKTTKNRLRNTTKTHRLAIALYQSLYNEQMADIEKMAQHKSKIQNHIYTLFTLLVVSMLLIGQGGAVSVVGAVLICLCAIVYQRTNQLIYAKKQAQSRYNWLDQRLGLALLLLHASFESILPIAGYLHYAKAASLTVVTQLVGIFVVAIGSGILKVAAEFSAVFSHNIDKIDEKLMCNVGLANNTNLWLNSLCCITALALSLELWHHIGEIIIPLVPYSLVGYLITICITTSTAVAWAITLRSSAMNGCAACAPSNSHGIGKQLLNLFASLVSGLIAIIELQHASTLVPLLAICSPTIMAVISCAVFLSALLVDGRFLNAALPAARSESAIPGLVESGARGLIAISTNCLTLLLSIAKKISIRASNPKLHFKASSVVSSTRSATAPTTASSTSFMNSGITHATSNSLMRHSKNSELLNQCYICYQPQMS